MKIVIYFYRKFLISFIICSISCFVLFYVFSLLGNLGEKISFSSILYLSFLNSFQIITYVPSVIVLLSLVLFVINLRSKNELMVIKEYLSNFTIILIFLPMAIIFTLVEINKKIASINIDNAKSNYLNSDQNTGTKVIINKDGNKKTYIILKNIDITNSKINEFQKYQVIGEEIVSGEYSGLIELEKERILTNNYTKFDGIQIKNFKKENIILSNYNKLLVKNLIIKDYTEDEIIKFDLINISKFIYFVFFYFCLLLILFNKKIIDRKNKLVIPLFLTFLLLLYSVIISNFNINLYFNELQILAVILVILIFYKFFKYE